MSDLTITAKDVNAQCYYTGTLPADLNNLTIEVARIRFKGAIRAEGEVRAQFTIRVGGSITTKRCYIRGRRCEIVDGKPVQPTSTDQDLPESLVNRLLN
jgi:hypothetical protein